MRRGLLVALIAAAAAAFAPAGASAYEPCPGDPAQPWMGSSEGAQISIPSLNSPNGITSYAGTIFRPTDTATHPGLRPLVVLQHGLGGSQCGLHWAARMLAGNGYVSMIWTSPAEATTEGSFINAIDATRSAMAFARSPSNPYAGVTNGSQIELAGHSLGSVTSSRLQGMGDPGIAAVVALDSLRRYTTGDPAGAEAECLQTPAGQVVPTVPALGLAMDLPCNANPGFAPDDLKLAGFGLWRDAGLPVMQLVMRGFDHADFSRGGTDAQHQLLAYYWLAWNRMWLDGDEAARADLLAKKVNGALSPSLLSERFRSAAYLQPSVNTDDLASYLTDTKAPNTKRKGKALGEEVQRFVLLRFKFKANETATFECRADRGKWKRCSSPRTLRAKKLGRHRFSVRSTDEVGNRERQPLTWKYEVVR